MVCCEGYGVVCALRVMVCAVRVVVCVFMRDGYAHR